MKSNNSNKGIDGREVGVQLLTALAYAVCTRAAIALVEKDPNFAAVWFPAGLAVSVVLLYGARSAFAIFIGGILGNLGTASPLLPSCIIAAGSATEALLALLLARQVWGFDARLARTRDAITLALPIALLPSLVSAVTGTYALMLSGAVLRDAALSHAVMWWLGDALGVMVIAPVFLVWKHAREAMRWADTVLLLPIGVAIVAFFNPAPTPWSHYLFEFALLAIVVWCALQASQRSLALVSLLVAAIVVVGTSTAHGPFSTEALEAIAGTGTAIAGDFVQQAYIYSLALIMLVIGAARTEQSDSEARELAAGALFRSVWETAPDAAFVIDEKGTILNANPGASELTGYANQELVGEPIALIQPERLRAAHETGMQRFLASGEKRLNWRATEALVLDRAGTEIPVEIVFSESRVGTERGFIGFMRDISQRKEADAELRRSQTLFSTVFHQNPMSVVITRAVDNRIFEVNEATSRVFGYAREEIVGKTTAELNTWPSTEVRDALITQLRATGRIDSIETKLRHRDGHFIDALYMAQVVDFVGERCVVATVVDITARKRAEAMQRVSEERFAMVFRACPDAIIISGIADGKYVEVNDAWLTLCGYSREELIGRGSVELGIWADRAERDKMVAQLTCDGKLRDFEFKLRRRDGSQAIAMMSAEVISLSGEECILSVLSDITERKRAEAQLRESERRFADVVEAAGEFVWESDAQSRLTYLSDRVEKVLGYRPDELLGLTPSAAYMSEAEALRVRQWFATRGDELASFGGLEHIALTKSGEEIWLRIAGVPRFDDAGSYVGFRGTGLDITERRRAQERIEELATRDTLTQLPNRRLLMDRLSQGLLASQRSQIGLAVLFIDLDRFKTINDSLGHAMGDQLLIQAAERLSGLTRRGDTLARLGGDEFVVVLSGVRLPEAAGVVAAKMIALLSTPFKIDNHILNTSASIGISLFPDDAEDAATLIRNADMAMYAAKEGGRHGYQFFSAEMNARALERHALENALRGAIAAQEFVLHYHPKFCLQTGELKGAEALVRWMHPSLGLISPGRFISVAEDTGLIGELGGWVLAEAVSQVAKWNASTFARGGSAQQPIALAVNLSVAQLTKTLPVVVQNVLQVSDFHPEWLELEITESVLMKNVDDNINVLRELSSLGVSIAIDDFGTGYSSLAYLRRFGADTLKIDRSFVRDLASDPDDAAIVEAIIALARTLGLSVVAEGVETETQKKLLADLGCDYAQGFLYCEPLPAEQFSERYLRV